FHEQPGGEAHDERREGAHDVPGHEVDPVAPPLPAVLLGGEEVAGRDRRGDVGHGRSAHAREEPAGGAVVESDTVDVTRGRGRRGAGRGAGRGARSRGGRGEFARGGLVWGGGVRWGAWGGWFQRLGVLCVPRAASTVLGHRRVILRSPDR